MFSLNAKDRWRRGALFGVSLATAVGWPASAFAQPAIAPPGHADVVPAVLVFFGVVLGLILVCRSSGRTAEMKLEELDDE